MTTQQRNRFGPFVGGFVGGMIGYLAGAMWNPLAAVILFFLCAYVGYDFKGAAKCFAEAVVVLPGVAKKTLNESVKEARAFGTLYRKYWFVAIPWTILALIVFNCFVGGSHRANPYYEVFVTLQGPFIEANIASVPYTLDILQMIVTGDSRYAAESPLAGDLFMDRWPRVDTLLSSAIMVVGAILGGGFLTCILVACSVFVAMIGVGLFNTLLVWKQWPLTIAWMLFWPIAFVAILPLWIAATALTAMYSVRRLVCGVVTVATGIGYLWLVPVPATTQLVGLAAIGCGVACGLASYGAFALIGAPAVMSRLKAMRERTLVSFSPLPELPWWTELTTRRYADELLGPE